MLNYVNEQELTDLLKQKEFRDNTHNTKVKFQNEFILVSHIWTSELKLQTNYKEINISNYVNENLKTSALLITLDNLFYCSLTTSHTPLDEKTYTYAIYKQLTATFYNIMVSDIYAKKIDAINNLKFTILCDDLSLADEFNHTKNIIEKIKKAQEQEFSSQIIEEDTTTYFNHSVIEHLKNMKS